MDTTKRARPFTVVLLTLFAVVALVVASVIAWLTVRDTGETTAAPDTTDIHLASTYSDDLTRAARRCPTVLTSGRLARYINEATGWNPNGNSNRFAVAETVSVAGLPPGMWDAAGGGDPTDTPTAIRHLADLWCGNAETLTREGVVLDYDVPAPAHPDDDPHAAALGLAAIFMGMDNVRSGQVPVNHHPVVADAMRWIL